MFENYSDWATVAYATLSSQDPNRVRFNDYAR